MKLRLTCQLILFSIVFFFLFSEEAFSLSLIPARVNITTKPGETYRQTFTIKNDQNASFRFNVYAWDFKIINGKTNYFPPKDNKSLSNFAEIVPVDFVLSPNEKKNVEMVLKVPEKISGSNQFVLFFEAGPVNLPKFQKNNKYSVIKSRLGALIFHDTEGTLINTSKIKSVKINPNDNGFLNLNLEVSNEGNSNINGYAFITVMDKDYNFVGKFETNTKLIPSGSKEILTGIFNTKLKKGKYHALIDYSFREKNTVIDKVFEIP